MRELDTTLILQVCILLYVLYRILLYCTKILYCTLYYYTIVVERYFQVKNIAFGSLYVTSQLYLHLRFIAPTPDQGG